jgi:hypothetical protein
MRARVKSLSLTSRTTILFLTAVLAAIGVLALIVARQVMAQTCPSNPCAGDPCCGLVENCSPTQSSCQNAGWVWNFSNNTCSNPPTTSSACDDMGMFWNFTSGVCQDDPPTQIVCEGVQAFWNFTNGTCGSSPAIGMCGAGPDWGNYFSSGCWSSLGLFGGSLCDRSTTFKNKCYQYEGEYDSRYCVCTGCGSCGGSPILIDVPGGFDMTDVAHGVRFDLNSVGGLDRVSWTSPTSTAAWLVLDGNRDGYINNGRELFGNFTFQSEPQSSIEKNGFRALAEWDKAENGGNHDSAITQNDYVFSKLRLWRDANQNGISDPGELRGLWEFGIEKISLDYRESRHRDQHGNEFRYRAKVYGAKDEDLGRWAYDVYLLGGQ